MVEKILSELEEIKKLLLEIRDNQKQFKQACDTRRRGINRR